MLEVWTQDGGQAGPEVSGGSRGQEHTATEKVKGQGLCEPLSAGGCFHLQFSLHQ